MRKSKFTVAAIVLAMALLFTCSLAAADGYNVVTGKDGSCGFDNVIKFDNISGDFKTGCRNFEVDTTRLDAQYQAWTTPITVYTKAGNQGDNCPTGQIESVGDSVYTTGNEFYITLNSLEDGVWNFTVCADARHGLSHWGFWGTLDTTEYGSICGYKYLDGELEEGWTIYLYEGQKADDDELGEGDNFVTSATTGSDGKYCFCELDLDKEYYVYEESRAGISQVGPAAGYYGPVTPDAYNSTSPVSYDFCNETDPAPELGSICGHKYRGAEGAMPLVWDIYLYQDEQPEVVGQDYFAIATTDATTGEYCFGNLALGHTYYVYEAEPTGAWYQIAPNNPNYYTVELNANNKCVSDQDFRNDEEDDGLGEICVFKYKDINGDSEYNSETEPGLADWEIQLWVQQARLFEADTDVDADWVLYKTKYTGSEENLGEVCFTDLPYGTYKVTETLQDGYTQTQPKDNDEANDYYIVTLSEENTSEYLYFGNKPNEDDGDDPGSICGHKFNDSNKDGVWDKDNEVGLKGWTIKLYRCNPIVVTVAATGECDWELYAETTTDADGSYCFNDLEPGAYKVAEELKDNWKQTAPKDDFFVVELAEGQNINNLDFGNYKKDGGGGSNDDNDDGNDDNGNDDNGNDDNGGNDNGGDDIVGGGSGGGGNTPEEIVVPETPTPMAPAPAPQQPQPQPVEVPVVVPQAPPELPFTGGNPMAFVYAGFALAGLGTLLRRKFR